MVLFLVVQLMNAWGGESEVKGKLTPHTHTGLGVSTTEPATRLRLPLLGFTSKSTRLLESWIHPQNKIAAV